MPSNAKKTPSLEKRAVVRKEALSTMSERLSDLLDKTSEYFVMTGAELAKKADISEGIISNYKSGKNTPSVTHLKSMAVALRVDSDYLLGLSEIRRGNATKKAIAKRLGLTEKAITKLVKHNTDPRLKNEDFTAAMNFFIESEYFQEIVSGIVEAKSSKLYLDHYKSLPPDKGEAFYNSIDWRHSVKSEIKNSYGETDILQTFKNEYAFARWRIAYTLERMLDEGLDNLSGPIVETVNIVTEWERKAAELGISIHDYIHQYEKTEETEDIDNGEA